METTKKCIPVSGMLNAIEEKPFYFVINPTIESLRAFLDGYSLGVAERGYFDCLDLDGFDHWLRSKYKIQGYFRWERFLWTPLGDLYTPFRSAIHELREFRASKGPYEGPHFTITRVSAPQNSDTISD